MLVAFSCRGKYPYEEYHCLDVANEATLVAPCNKQSRRLTLDASSSIVLQNAQLHCVQWLVAVVVASFQVEASRLVVFQTTAA